MGRRKLSDEEIKAAADRAGGKVTPSDEASGEATVGRPVEYNKAYVEQVKMLCKLGATDMEIAEFFGVNEVTFYRWKAKYPEFCKATRTAKEEADERVQRSLYHRAVGYTFTSEKIFQFQGEIIRAKTREHVPPETAACSLWLRNRRPAEWRDKVFAEMNVNGEVRFVVEGGPAVAPPMKTIEAVATEG
jgi:hypothetical protein